MLWIFASLAVAVIFTIANIFDSHMLQKRVPSLASYILPLSVMQFLIGLVFMMFFPFPHDAGFTHLLVAFGSGISNAFALYILLVYLQKGEVSRVVPVTTSSPIFVAILFLLMS